MVHMIITRHITNRLVRVKRGFRESAEERYFG